LFHHNAPNVWKLRGSTELKLLGGDGDRELTEFLD
jgi:hypothetical protein